MVKKSLIRGVVIAAMIGAGVLGLRAQGGAALTGMVSSAAEPKMEGVLVTARRDGANFDVTVVSDAQGKYSFPRSHVGAGHYTIKIRAVGYGEYCPVDPEHNEEAWAARVGPFLQFLFPASETPV